MKRHYALAGILAMIGIIALAVGASYALREVIAAFVLFTIGFAALSFLAGIGVLIGFAGKAGGNYARSKALSTGWTRPGLPIDFAEFFNNTFQQARAIQWGYLWIALKHRLSIPSVSSPIH